MVTQMQTCRWCLHGHADADVSVVSPWSRGCRRVGGVSMVTRMQKCRWCLHGHADADALLVSP